MEYHSTLVPLNPAIGALFFFFWYLGLLKTLVLRSIGGHMLGRIRAVHTIVIAPPSY